MTTRPFVLLVTGEAGVVAAFETAAETFAARIEHASVPSAGLAAVRGERPDLIAVGPAGTSEAAIEMVRLFSRDPAPETPVVLIAARPDPILEREALDAGAADVLTLPTEAEAAAVRIRWAVRVRQLRERHRFDARELERLEEAERKHLEGVIRFLEHLIETALPGARDRGARIAQLAGRLAERFEIPEAMRSDLERAARLHEVGRLARTDGGSIATAPRPDSWPYALSTQALLAHVQGMREIGDLVAGIYENWDGTGHPEHRLQGQIPLRSRILRALIDFVAALERPGAGDPDRALAAIAEHSGTRYDPMVIAQLEALLGGEFDEDWRGTRLLLPVTDLRVGMVLAEDLYTNSGLKLLSRATTLTANALETILRRHRAEPILHAAAVQRPAA